MASEKAKFLFDSMPKSFWDAATRNNGTILSFLRWSLGIVGALAAVIMLRCDLTTTYFLVIDILLWVFFFILLIVIVYVALTSPDKLLKSSLNLIFETALGDNENGETYTSSTPVQKTQAKLKLGNHKTDME